MPTMKPRITITLSNRQHDVLRSISENSGQSMSAFVHEMLEQSLPVLERMAESFRKIKAAQDEQKKRIADDLDQAQAAVEPILAQVLGQFDLFMSRIEGAAGGVATVAARAGDAAAPGTAPTPVTNRGVTPSPSKTRKASAGKASSRSRTANLSSKKGGS